MTEETTTPQETDASATTGARPSPAASTDAAETTTSAPTSANTEMEDALRARIADLAGQVAELERQVGSEREAASDYMHRWQQSQADFSNFRRRTRQEQEQAQRFLGLEATARILPALDSLERAFSTLPPTLRSLTWVDGIALIHMQLRQGLASLGIEAVGAEPGQPFDPQVHEAIGEVETAEHPEGHIAVVVQRGYMAGATLLRPALVQVARAAPTSAQLSPSSPSASSAPDDMTAGASAATNEATSQSTEETSPSSANAEPGTHDTHGTRANEHTEE